MSFLGGVIVGGVAGLTAGMLIARRGGSTPSTRNALPITIAALALVASGVALARSGHHGQTSTTTAATVPATTAATAPSVVVQAPTTSTTLGGPTVSVPNVVTFTRDTAVTAIEKLGLKANIETLNLANVPTGFVVSQTPLPASVVPVGSTVSLEVSSPG